MAPDFTDVHLVAQRRATAALLKFCQDHRYDGPWLSDLRVCLASLQRGDTAAAFRSFHKVPLGGNGCFNDWWPPVVFEHEDQDYVWTVFEALTGHWSCVMQLALVTGNE
jgi:hypothetical protein